MLKFLPHSIFLLIILSIASMVRAEISFGGYLAGRHALSTKDFDAASTYLSRAIEDDIENPELLNGLISVQVSLGDIGAAKISSDNLDLLGVQTQLSNMVKIAIQLRNRDFDNAKQQIENEQGINPLLDKIVTGWAFADQGNFEDAETIFDEIGKGSSLAQFSQMQKASMLAAYGRYESALNTIENLEKNSNRISIDARALKVQLLLKLENKEEATEYFSRIFGDGVNSDAANLR
ncbi:MAG: hypothetical protein EBX03_12870, partial [Rhodobacteraceae bacterium]|nr:hypothetical protein [Paracoccaceae bacterium]